MEKITTTGLTTQELLQWLKDCLDYYVNTSCRATTIEEYKFKYEVAKSVSETLRINEIMLLYYLRNSNFGDVNLFMEIAKRLYEASQALERIKSIGDKAKGKRGNLE